MCNQLLKQDAKITQKRPEEKLHAKIMDFHSPFCSDFITISEKHPQTLIQVCWITIAVPLPLALIHHLLKIPSL